MKLRVGSAVLICLITALDARATDQFPSSLDIESFEAAWQAIDESYFDPEFGGMDWPAIHARYQALIHDASDLGEYYRIMNDMVFELHRSHSAVIPPGNGGEFLPTTYASGSPGFEVRWLDGEAIVTSVKPNSAAASAGIQGGFKIISIDGERVVDTFARGVSFTAPPFNDAGTKQSGNNALLGNLYGETESTLVLTYEGEGGKQDTVHIVREARRGAPESGTGLPPCFLEFETRHLSESIGYIRFNMFHPALNSEVEQDVADFASTDGIILDLRGNPGGYLDAMVQVAQCFLSEQVVLVTLVMRDQSIGIEANPNHPAYSGKLVILVDALSTSGSEMLPICFQMLGRASVVGERTQGAVTGSGMLSLPNGAVLMYPYIQTLAYDGTDPEGVGVLPDILVGLNRDELRLGIDSQLEAAIELINAMCLAP